MFLELTSKFTHFWSLLSSRLVFGGYNYKQVNTFLKRTSMTGSHTLGWRIFASICTYTYMYGAYITSKHKPLGGFTSNHSHVSCMKPSSKHKHMYTIELTNK